MYSLFQITTMAYETWVCKFRPYLPDIDPIEEKYEENET